MSNDFLSSLPSDSKNLLLKIYEALVEKVTLKLYNRLEEEEKSSFLKVFSSGSEEEKINFLKNYFSDFRKLLIEEIEKVAQEIRGRE
ncbi:MAG: DUF5663 domain-containing protein [Candidatus Paceibacterota bacterium]